MAIMDSMSDSSIIQTSYDYRLVALSVLIAVFSSYAALELAARVSTARRTERLAWLTGGALPLGAGIWSMHYTGMLACRLPMTVYYHVPTVVLSLLAAVIASAVALFVVGRRQIGVLHIALGSVLMAAAIAGMHYIGMSAMRLPAMHHYDTTLVIASVVVAWIVSLVGLGLIKLNLVLGSGGGGSEKLLKFISSLTMGIAIPIMHYTGMAAVTYTPMDTSPDLSYAIDISALANTAVILITLIMLAAVFLIHRWPALAGVMPEPQTHPKT
jgi:two-component system, sensor histidine kinase and response regulator